jgi:hypothetical protein
MSSNIYNIFGKEESISLFKTQELKSDNIYVYYYQNSISSFVFFIPAIFLNLYCKSFIDIYISIQLHLMSIISFFWWACQRKYIHYFDIILYSNLISISGLYLLNTYNIISEFSFFYYNFNFVLLILILIHFNLFYYIKIINILSSLFSVYNLIFFNYYKTFTFLIFGLISKLMDTYIKINICKKISGTAIFHIMTGIGYFFLLY